MIRHEPDGYWIELEITIASHHEEVFASLTTAGGLTRWFPVAAEIEPRAGGKLVLGWDEEFARKTTLSVIEYDSGGHVTWDWFAGPADRHAPVYWTVEPSVEHGCRVRFRQGPFMEDTDSLVAMADEAASWQWRLCNLRTTLEAKVDMRKVRPL